MISAALLRNQTKDPVKITEKSPIFSGINPRYDRTEFGPLYFQGH